MQLGGKVSVITGAGSGIGHGIAKRFVEAGGRVAIADINAEAAEQTARELGDAKTAIGVKMDVSNEAEVNAGVDRIAKAFGTGRANCASDRGLPLLGMEENVGDPSRRRILDDQGVHQVHVCAE